MLEGSELTFPASGVLAAWSRQLAPWQPHALWVGHLFVHRVEALAQSATTATLERLPALVLQALALTAGPALSSGTKTALPRHLRERLHLPEAIVHQVLHALVADELIERDSLALTEEGRRALVQGRCARRTWQRRAFTLIQRWDEAGRPAAPPQFVTIDGAAGAEAWTAAPAWQDLWLRDCLGQPEAWKQACGFPAQVLALADAAPPAVPAWQRVTVVQPERIQAALVVGRHGAAARLLGFAVRGASLHAAVPILAAAPELQGLAPELTPTVTSEAIRQAWVDWCEGHGIVTPLAPACPCEVDGLTLKVQAPALLLHELRGKRCGLDGQEWVVVGTGPMRRAVALRVGGP